jgi:hypothetical protein
MPAGCAACATQIAKSAAYAAANRAAVDRALEELIAESNPQIPNPKSQIPKPNAERIAIT